MTDAAISRSCICLLYPKFDQNIFTLDNTIRKVCFREYRFWTKYFILICLDEKWSHLQIMKLKETFQMFINLEAIRTNWTYSLNDHQVLGFSHLMFHIIDKYQSKIWYRMMIILVSIINNITWFILSLRTLTTVLS